MERAVLYRVPKKFLEYRQLSAVHLFVVRDALSDSGLDLRGQILVRRGPGAHRGSYDVREVPLVVLVQGLDPLSAPIEHGLDQCLDDAIQRILETRSDRDDIPESLEVLDLFWFLHPVKGPGHVDELGVHATQVLSRDVRLGHVTVPNLSGHDVFSERKVVWLRLVYELQCRRGHRKEPVQETPVKLEFLVRVESHYESVHHIVLVKGMLRESRLNRSGHVVFSLVPFAINEIPDQVQVIRVVL